jgi:hypothetical protein
MRMNAEKRGKIKSKLNKRLVRQTLKGYARADKSIEAEKRAWLQTLTAEQSWELFDELFEAWEQLRPYRDAGWENLEKRRLEEKIALRRVLDRVAQSHKRR